jgi:hypothetical protein
MSSSGSAGGPIFNPEWYAPLWNGYHAIWLQTRPQTPACKPTARFPHTQVNCLRMHDSASRLIDEK